MNPSPEAAVEVPGAPLPPVEEKRTTPDRRDQPTSPWDAFPPAGQRMRNRRANEHQRPYFVDRFPAAMLAFILILVLASIADAVLTIQLLQAGADEVNPVMDCLLGCGFVPFLVVKYLLTVVGLPLLLIFKNHYLFGSRFRIGYLIPLTVVLYGVLIGYQIVLIHQHVLL